MSFGLTDQALQLITGVFRNYPQVTRVALYGSRATGAFRPNSDIDLALWGEIDNLLLGRIATELDELPLPYHFDVAVYERLSNPALKAHIDQAGQPLFARETSS